MGQNQHAHPTRGIWIYISLNSSLKNCTYCFFFFHWKEFQAWRKYASNVERPPPSPDSFVFLFSHLLYQQGSEERGFDISQYLSTLHVGCTCCDPLPGMLQSVRTGRRPMEPQWAASAQCRRLLWHRVSLSPFL